MKPGNHAWIDQDKWLTIRFAKEEAKIDDVRQIINFLKETTWFGKAEYATIDFSQNDLGDDAAGVIFEYLGANKIKLKLFKYYQNKMTDRGLSKLANLLRNQDEGALELHLSHNRITAHGAAGFFRVLGTLEVYPTTFRNWPVPVWIRMEQNMIDAKYVLEALDKLQITYCLCEDRIKCCPTRCGARTDCPKLHLASFSDQLEEKAKASPKLEPKAKWSPKLEPKAKASPKLEPKAKASPKLEPKTKASPKLEPKAKSSPKLEPKNKKSPRGKKNDEGSVHSTEKGKTKGTGKGKGKDLLSAGKGKDGKKQTSQPKYSGKCNQWESGWWEEDWCEDDWEETSSWRGDEWWEDGWKNNWDWNTDGWKGGKGKGGRWSPREESNWSSPKPSSRSDRQASGSPTPATSSHRVDNSNGDYHDWDGGDWHHSGKGWDSHKGEGKGSDWRTDSNQSFPYRYRGSKVPSPLKLPPGLSSASTKHDGFKPLYIFLDSSAILKMTNPTDHCLLCFEQLLFLCAQKIMVNAPRESSGLALSPVQEAERIVFLITDVALDILGQIRRTTEDIELAQRIKWLKFGEDSALAFCYNWGILEIVQTKYHDTVTELTKKECDIARQYSLSDAVVSQMDFLLSWARMARSSEHEGSGERTVMLSGDSHLVSYWKKRRDQSVRCLYIEQLQVKEPAEWRYLGEIRSGRDVERLKIEKKRLTADILLRGILSSP